MKKISLSSSVIKAAALNTVFMFLIFFVFNIFVYIVFTIQFNRGLDSHLIHEMEHIANSLLYENKKLIVTNPDEFRESDLLKLTDDPFFLQVYTQDGEVIFTSENLKLYKYKIPVKFPALKDKIIFSDLTAKPNNYRAAYMKLMDNNSPSYLIMQLTKSKVDFGMISKKFILFNLISFPVFLLLIIIISIYLAKKIYDPIINITSIANRISANNLKERIKYESSTSEEMALLSDTLNDLFNRLDKQVHQISNFSDNASHQLLTPVTIIKSELNIIKNSYNDNSLEIIEKQVNKITKIVQSLLILSRDSQNINFSNKILDVNKEISDLLNDYYNKYYDRIYVELLKDIYIKADPEYFRIAIQNILENALKYSEDTVNIKLNKLGDNFIIISVIDKGIGIKPEDKVKVFERFYRTREVERIGLKGSGLGLSLSKFLIENMNGKIEIKDNEPKGTIFNIKFKQIFFT